MDPSCSSSLPSTTQPLPYHTVLHPEPNHTSADLPSTIALIQNLTTLAESTIDSIYEFLSSTPSSSSAASYVGRCPFDSRHLLPPESLFRHSLTCSSAPGSRLLDLGFLDNLHYPKSLRSEDQLLKENIFVRPLPEAEADICFSLEGELGEIYSNFFYKDCPGVVTSPEPSATCRTFTLPAILSSECANFINERCEGGGDLEHKVGILPSDLLALRSEVEAWSNFPAAYSHRVLLVAVHMHRADEFSLKRWIIMNSPKFGILIDAAMRDHAFLLLKLCLKVVRTEAVCSLKLFLEKKGFLDPKVVRFECPQLVSSLTWLASQISVLYGEVHGKFFVMGMLKESFLFAGRCLMLFRREDKNIITGNMEVEVHKLSEISSCDKVFVSQVASAIAALHERSLLEQRLNALRFAVPLPRFHRLNEYISTSIRASQERAKRSNYRALLEHDGLLWQRPNNPEFGKSKTREELLAEERDYKRRRMSYRGKKLKRNTTQVLHDIIEEHMEEIYLAGGIGCNVKMASENTFLPKFESERSKGLELRCSSNDAYEAKMMKEKTHEHDSLNDGSSTGSLRKAPHETRYEFYDDQHKLEKTKRETLNYRSRSPSYHSGYSHSRDRYSEQTDQTNWRSTRDKYERRGSNYMSSYKDYDNRSTLTSKSHEATRFEYNCTLQSRRRCGSRASEKQRTDSSRVDMFEDRYEPSRSYDSSDTFYEVDSGGSHYLQPQKPVSLKNDSEHHYKK
ncbi:U11/U12 small nuclear ribonucleoprotein 48 kDa protein [Phalaenopsis equestris]|uniref:U11/U12 small nuclear ribonucleoprotein 48 kDa protein n=1 Tax=Phalaenopsis equestris TaxID=78828 RepID=UPI0009E232EE|nr:U11/U12 small nuclear ribonucleoprotein 48 kDa protein [Phalaenopsis equestris]